MRLLVITSLYPRPGAELDAPFNRLQVAALARRHEVAVVAPVTWTEQLRRWKQRTPIPPVADQGGVRVYHPTYFFPPRILRHEYGRFYLASVRRAVGRAVRAVRPDVMFACWAHPDGWAAVHLARAAGLPVLVKVHGSDVLVNAQDPRRRARIAEALRRADGVVAVSRDLADHVVQLGVRPDRVHVVPHGTDTTLFHPGDRGAARAKLGLPADGTMLLFVGNLKLSKGAGVLVEACRLLRDQGVEFRCYLVGRGPDEGEVRQLIAAGDLGDRVLLPGPRPQMDLPDWYRAANLVVLPSFSEGVPNVLREALACDRPFVATRVGGIPEITRPPAGRLVPPGDPAALAEAVRAALAEAPVVGPADRAVNVTWDESAELIAKQLRALLP